MTPILTAHLLPTIEARLIELLRSLRADEWEAETVAPAWNVKDAPRTFSTRSCAS